MKIRGFELVSSFTNEDLLPKRETAHAAGYDLKVAERTVIAPGDIKLVPTGIKAYMQDDEYLGVHIRSSIAVKKHISLVNNQGIIDADYYNNADNEGHIMLALLNMGTEPVALAKNERVAQGIFYKYLVADGDADIDKAVRGGGFGSTKS